MYRTSSNVDALAARLGIKDRRAAVGLIVLLKELDSDLAHDNLPDALFWLAIGGKIRGASRADVIEAYRCFLQDEQRMKEREKKRRQRASGLSRLEGDKSGEMSPEMSPEMSRFEGDISPSPSPPSPFPLSPPSPPAPPVTPYNPPYRNPHNPSRDQKNANAIIFNIYSDACARLGINSAWRHSPKARNATAQRIVDWCCENNCPCAKYNTLFTLVVEALENGVPPEAVMLFAKEDDTGNSFGSNVFMYSKDTAFRKLIDRKTKGGIYAQT